MTEPPSAPLASRSIEDVVAPLRAAGAGYRRAPPGSRGAVRRRRAGLGRIAGRGSAAGPSPTSPRSTATSSASRSSAWSATSTSATVPGSTRLVGGGEREYLVCERCGRLRASSPRARPDPRPDSRALLATGALQPLPDRSGCAPLRRPRPDQRRRRDSAPPRRGRTRARRGGARPRALARRRDPFSHPHDAHDHEQSSMSTSTATATSCTHIHTSTRRGSRTSTDTSTPIGSGRWSKILPRRVRPRASRSPI